ncbi:MAG: hypothetical protein O3A12_05450 [Actinobacteria bacterium]|jgi:hypothetical protein|nr:hypothetical protein [Actinomycetota bacterium]MDA2984609.1 hypothetical protein [Actinomycetota bacterium]
MIIDCKSCALYQIEVEENPACTDCVVSVIISRKPEEEISAETGRALAHLSSTGLVPPLRYFPVNFG